MTGSGVLIAAALAALAAGDGRAPLIEFGGDASRGVLVNLTAGAGPGDPAGPLRPTLVFIHGFNPLPRAVHFTMAGQVAGALGRRFGPGCNAFGWEWNAATCVGLHPGANHEAAVAQGRALAEALRRSGAEPGGIHLVGHSSGCIVAASAARTFACEYGRPIAQLTLLEPARSYHDVVFDRLDAGRLARRVENYWSRGPSAFGREAARPGVDDLEFNAPCPHLGVVSPRHSSHLSVVRWYIDTIEDPCIPSGFNRSLILGPPG